MTNLNRILVRVPSLVVLIALLAMVTTLPARAQDNHIQRYGEEDKVETATQKAAKKEADQAYQRSLGNIPAQKNADPWGTVRSEEPPKAAKAAKAAPAKPKATTAAAGKTGDAAKQ